jgi:hypothetical protein
MLLPRDFLAVVDDLLLVLSRRRDFRLGADGAPHPRQSWQSMYLDLILEDESLGSLVGQGVFF